MGACQSKKVHAASEPAPAAPKAAPEAAPAEASAAAGTGAAAAPAPAEPGLADFLNSKVDKKKGSSGFRASVAGKRLNDSYSLGDVLGRGGFGEVRRAIRRADGKA